MAPSGKEREGRAPGWARKPKGSGAAPDPFVRAENEDDDGYDPYSDRRAHEPLFEEDPWR